MVFCFIYMYYMTWEFHRWIERWTKKFFSGSPTLGIKKMSESFLAGWNTSRFDLTQLTTWTNKSKRCRLRSLDIVICDTHAKLTGLLVVNDDIITFTFYILQKTTSNMCWSLLIAFKFQVSLTCVRNFWSTPTVFQFFRNCCILISIQCRNWKICA